MIRKLQQWNGAGNDFLVDVDTDENLAHWTAEAASAACDRSTGLGADGLLLASLRGETLGMKLFNSDGSVAEMSGNGIRCLVAAAHRATTATWTEVNVETDAGARVVTLNLNGTSGTGSAWMGHVRIDEPLPGTLGVANVGNPHVVVADDESWSVEERTARAEALADQMGGANVEFVVPADPMIKNGVASIAMRVHERGVGETLSCGTGICAAALATRSLIGKDAPNQWQVSVPGGTLGVRMFATEEGEHVGLSGAANLVYDGVFEL